MVKHMRPLLALGFALALRVLSAQPSTQDAKNPKYELATVKPTPPGVRGGQSRPEPGGLRYRGTNLPLRYYIASAYQIKPDQLTDEPGWVDTEGFDIEAQAAKPSNLEEHHLMMRSLLAERFHLQIHFATKEMPVYVLTVDNNGAKMKLHDSENSGDPWIEQSADAPLHMKWKATSSPMQLLAYRLGMVMDRPVIDQTGLKGDYDFLLTYTMEPPPGFPADAKVNGQPIDLSGPTIFQALPQQLGLRLEARKGPVQILEVEHVEEPSGN